MYQSNISINVDVINKDLKGLLDDKSGIILLRSNTPLPVMFLTKSQKRNTKEKACKEKKKLQLQTPSGLNEYIVLTFSKKSPEYTPS
ncbi:hypothetical protein RclHR1_28410001 [Rhizophagus clarus]|uniref:Uncharacterized protein n=1 Tax=Rhizophagus clarus TaxID=94130 RepID=A0A2Z6R3Y4_9GLOM|nr:hypothetical protein RclHR1_28410001 [Rhizophagus clarus]GES76764.1 hypothetical protein RCL_e12612_RclHR1_28410001 [Rhizophagus clarus]